MPEHVESTPSFGGQAHMDKAREHIQEHEVGFVEYDEVLMDGNEKGDTTEDRDDHAAICEHAGTGTGLTSADMDGAAFSENTRPL